MNKKIITAFAAVTFLSFPALSDERMMDVDHLVGMIDLDKNGAITEKEFSQSITVLSSYFDRKSGDVKESWKWAISHLDKNMDNIITTKEVKEAYKQRFELFDADKNGVISSSEERQGRYFEKLYNK